MTCDLCKRPCTIDTIVAHELWEKIKPDLLSAQGVGFLCAACMADRIVTATDWPSVEMVNSHAAKAIRRDDPRLVALVEAATNAAAGLRATGSQWPIVLASQLENAIAAWEAGK
jgi:hypothetical protein